MSLLVNRTSRLSFLKKSIAKCLFSALVATSVISYSAVTHAQDEPKSEGGTDEDIAGSLVYGVAKDKPYSFFTLTFQNDVFVNEDDGYTNGLGFTFGKGPFLSFTGNINPFLDSLTKKLYIRTMPDKVHGIAYMFFQRMQTPEDITAVELQPDDLPYAGLLAMQTTMYAWDQNASDQFSIFLGVVGDVALGEQAQKAVHAAIGSDEPLGWDNQIENEPVFRLESLRVQKLYKKYNNGRGFDVLGLGAIGIGNLRSDLVAGVVARYGSNMNFSHATFSLQTDRQVNSLSLSPRNDYFVYLGVQGSLVANDILIDGNTFEDSHSLPLNHVQNQVTGGIVFKYKKLAYVFQITSNSAGADGFDAREKFGALAITWSFR